MEKVYIALKKQTKLRSGKVKLKDVATISKKRQELNEFVIINNLIEDVVVSIIDIIDKINKQYPNLEVISLGEASILITKVKNDKLTPFKIVAIVFSAIVFFVGGIMSLLSFHADIDAPTLQSQISKWFTGSEEIDQYTIIPYSIGIAVGVVIFLGWPTKKEKNLPTLLNIEIFEHDKQIADYKKGEE